MNNDGLKITIGVLAAIFVALLVTIVMKSGSSAKGTQVAARPTTVVSRTIPATGFMAALQGISPLDSPVSKNMQPGPTNPPVPPPPTNTPVPPPPPPQPTSTPVPPPPTATPKPTTGTLQIAMRHADGSPVLNTGAELFVQTVDINGDPMLGKSVGNTTSGSSGAATFNVVPGQYVALLSLAGRHFRPNIDRPGLANLTISAGQTTQISVKLGMVVSSLPGGNNTCLAVKNSDGSAYNADCKGFSSDGLSRVEVLPGTYDLVFAWGDLVQTYSDFGLLSISEGQVISKHCSGKKYETVTCD